MPIEPKLLKGFRDYLPDVMAPRQAMLRTIEAVFERQGFLPLMTPALEYAETLTGKYGEEGDKLLYQFADHGERQVALRYDLTVPLARVVAQHRGALAMPLRRYQIAPVWRADKPQRGRFREFVQCDADIAGANSAVADAEVLLTGLAVLAALGIDGAVLHLNHRHVLTGLLAAAGVTDEATQFACVRAIDKLDKVGVDGVRAELGRVEGVTEAIASEILALFADPELSLARIRDLLATRAGYDEARLAGSIGRLQQVVALVEAAGLGGQLRVDPTIARGLDYYTGIIYETRLTHPKVASMGAVMSGGRYDGLIGMFGKEAVPAVGISLGLDRLLAALLELGLVATAGAVPVYVTVFAEAQAGDSLRLAQHLRAQGLAVEVDTLGGKLGKQLERASKRGSRLAVVVGPEEAAAGEVVLKDLAAGTQEKLGHGALAPRVQALLAAG